MAVDVPRWHATDDELALYRAGDCSPVLAASLEAHLVRCDRCRIAIARIAGSTDTDRRWGRLTDAIDRPSPTVMHRLHVAGDDGADVARQIAVATPAMRWAWLAALTLVLAIPIAVGLMAGHAALDTLMALAPLAPIAAVALAYQGVADPAGEITLATPANGLRLITMRALIVSLAAIPLGLLTALLTDLPIILALAWLLPGLALASLVLAAGTTRWDPAYVAIALGGGWTLFVAAYAEARPAAGTAVAMTLAEPVVQTVCLAIALSALLLTFIRRDAVAYRRTT
jgi:hypothetical protein